MDTQAYKKMMVFCLIVALLVGIASIIGVFFRGDMSSAEVVSVRGEHYEMVTTGIYRYNSLRMVAEGVGWDVFTLFIALPALLFILPLLARGSLAGRLLAMGLLAYFFYQYLMYALAWAFGPLFLLYIIIYVLGLAGTIWLAASIDVDRLAQQVSETFPRRSMIALNVIMSLILILMWVQRIAAGLQGDLASAMLLGQTTMVIQALDLGMVVPLALFTTLALWRKKPSGYLLSAIFAVKAAAMFGAICAMLLVVWVTEGTLEAVPLILFGGAMLAAVYIGVRIYKSVRGWDADKQVT